MFKVKARIAHEYGSFKKIQRKDFSEKFIDLARSVYFNNDKRSKIKSEINKILGSSIKEVKQYTDY